MTPDGGGSWQERYDSSVADEQLRLAAEPSMLATELSSENPRWWALAQELRVWFMLIFVPIVALAASMRWLAATVGLPRWLGLAVGALLAVVLEIVALRRRNRSRRRARAILEMRRRQPR